MQMKRLKNLLYNTYLCIKYPFLYPRNRFTDKHEVHFNWNYKLRKYLLSKYNNEIFVSYKFYKNPKDCIEFNKSVLVNNKYRCTLLHNQILCIEGNGLPIFYNLQKHVGKSFEITGISLRNERVIYHCHKKEITKYSYGFCYTSIPITNKNIYYYLNQCHEWFRTHIINYVCGLPTYTELNAMPKGWRKAFGLQMCKEIKQALINDGIDVKKYRIMQIKEKFGYLRWYDNFTTNEVSKVIRKYENISYHTCIDCGKPAKYMTVGWISPYCENCIGNSKYTLIDGQESNC